MPKNAYFFGLGASLLITTLVTGSLIINAGSPLSVTRGDAFLVNFILKHWLRVITSGDWGSLTTLPMLFGFKDSLFFTDHHFIQAIMALPLYLLTKNVIITSNLLIVFTMFFSSFSMYLFAFHLTKKVLPGILASIIFVFNPFIMARFPDQLILFSLQWIPLIFLSWEKLIKSTTI